MKRHAQPLNPLLALEHDLLRTYAVAQTGLRDRALAESIERLRLEQQRHLSDLTALILRLGAKPRARRDLRGPMFEAMATVGVSISDETALRALLHAEQVAERAYQEAVDGPLPAAAAPQILHGLEGHRRRLAWFRPRVEERHPRQARP